LLEEAQAAQRAPRPLARPLSVSAPLTSVSIEGEVNNPTPGTQLTVRLGEERLTLRFCPAGSSLQGSAEAEGKPEEHPQHTLHLTRPYWLAETPITQAIWQQLCGAHPSKHHGPQLPVEGIAWASALRFCNLLSEQMGLEPAYELGEGTRALTHLNLEARGWRLPTEAEWEHAARAGQDPSWRYAGAPKLDTVGWFSGNSSDHAHPVGQKEPNAWGLLDMSGGVWEWCQDAWSKDAYRARVSGGERALIDPLHDVAQPLPRVIRGGSFYDYPMSCRVAARPALEVTGGYGVGFRPLLPA
jgi:formylglycine-generating enzyme required for sulfatase activity